MHGCVVCVHLQSLGKITHKNLRSVPTSLPLTALDAFCGFRTSITAQAGCPSPQGLPLAGTPSNTTLSREVLWAVCGGLSTLLPPPHGLGAEPVTMQEPTGFVFSHANKPPPCSYMQITRLSRHWPCVAVHSTPCGHGLHRLGHRWPRHPLPPTGPRSSLRKDEHCKAQYKGFISTQQITQTFL